MTTKCHGRAYALKILQFSQGEGNRVGTASMEEGQGFNVIVSPRSTASHGPEALTWNICCSDLTILNPEATCAPLATIAFTRMDEMSGRVHKRATHRAYKRGFSLEDASPLRPETFPSSSHFEDRRLVCRCVVHGMKCRMGWGLFELGQRHGQTDVPGATKSGGTDGCIVMRHTHSLHEAVVNTRFLRNTVVNWCVPL